MLSTVDFCEIEKNYESFSTRSVFAFNCLADTALVPAPPPPFLLNSALNLLEWLELANVRQRQTKTHEPTWPLLFTVFWLITNFTFFLGYFPRHLGTECAETPLFLFFWWTCFSGEKYQRCSSDIDDDYPRTEVAVLYSTSCCALDNSSVDVAPLIAMVRLKTWSELLVW